MIQVYTDGSCNFCRWVEQRVKRLDRRGRLEFLDYNHPATSVGLPFSPEELVAQMHVRGQDGTWTKGFFGWLTVLRALPALAWLGWLLALPPLRWLGPPFYRFVARHRYSLPGAPARCNPSCRRHIIVAAAVGAALLLPLCAPAQNPERSSHAEERGLTEDRAIELLRQNRLAEARAELEAILKDDPGNTRAEAYLAAAELQAGDVERALPRALRLLQADPDNPDLHALLGQAYMLNRDWAQAEKEWRTVLRERPNSEEARFQLASALLQLGHFQEGLNEVTRAAEINPRRSDARALRGNILASLGKTEEAVNEWNGALAGDANNAAALAGLAVYLREREPELALEYARRAVELSDWNAIGPIRILALVHRARGEIELGREVLRKAIVKFPDNPLLAAELRGLERFGKVRAEEAAAPVPGPAGELPLGSIRLPRLLPAQPLLAFADRGAPPPR